VQDTAPGNPEELTIGANPSSPGPAVPLRVRLGHSVRELRAQAGFSQESFSALIEVHRTFMGSLERGRANPSLETLERVARGLRMTPWELLKIAEADRQVRPAEPSMPKRRRRPRA
jgi:transcriptional regulator with XRE-family HTH domain